MRLLSTFHLVVNGQTARYELRRIHADGDRIVLQELAFGPSLMPLAAIPDRALKRIDATTLEFEGLTLRHTGPDSMIETLTVPTGNNGPARTLEIRYARALVFRPPHGPAGASAASQ